MGVWVGLVLSESKMKAAIIQSLRCIQSYKLKIFFLLSSCTIALFETISLAGDFFY